MTENCRLQNVILVFHYSLPDALSSTLLVLSAGIGYSFLLAGFFSRWVYLEQITPLILPNYRIIMILLFVWWHGWALEVSRTLSEQTKMWSRRDAVKWTNWKWKPINNIITDKKDFSNLLQLSFMLEYISLRISVETCSINISLFVYIWTRTLYCLVSRVLTVYNHP